MKQVVTKLPPQDVTLITNLNREKFYGVTDKAGSAWKGFICLDKYSRDMVGPASVRCLHAFTSANTYGHHSSDGIYDLVKMMIGSGYIVYEFDNLSEMALWLES